MPTTVGKLLVNRELPPEFHTDEVLDKDAADNLLAEIARKYPQRYRDISLALMNLGVDAVYSEGTTLRLSDTRLPVDRKPYLQHVAKQTRKIMADKTLSDAEKAQAIEGVYMAVQDTLKDLSYDAALAEENPFALQVKSKARGNPSQLTALMTTPGVYEDAEGRIIPTFIERSYAEGLRPHEYFAGTYGARKSVISTKFATRDAGYLGKQFNTVSTGILVTEDDCETLGGIPVKTDDRDNIGAVLAKDTGDFKAGTVLSRSTLAELGKSSDEIVVRSPTTCSAKKGICKQCTGIRESGDFPNIGDNVGINASTALAERIAQSSLNVKHSGGIADSSGEVTYAGFPVVEQLAQIPKVFPNQAPLASLNGRIDEITPAPQGGQHIVIDGEKHYVPEGRKIYVKPGDKVERGDQLAVGIVNPREVVAYKGIGEGRRYWVDRMTQAFRDSNFGASRRNIEVVARSMVDHMQSDDLDGGAMPGEILSYNTIAHRYKPRAEAQMLDAKDAVGKYLEQPVMHYTIGTRLTKGMADKLDKHGYGRVMAHDKAPPFEPHMMSLREIPQHEKDWVAQLGSSYLKTNLLKNVHLGAESNIHGLNPIPAIAKGTEIGNVPKGEVGY